MVPFLRGRPAPVADPTAPLLEIRDMHYTVPRDSRKRLFRGTNLVLEKHELIIIVGENGVGKSTFFSLLINITSPDCGTFLYRGVRLKAGQRRLHIAVAFQRPADFFVGRSLLEELTLGYFEATPDDVRAVMHSVGLGSVSLVQRPETLSGGQQKRLAIAGQLMRTRVGEVKPEIFLLDEPMAGVDVTGRRELAELVSELKKEFCVIIISHEPNELLPYCDRVLQLAGGQFHEVDREVLKRARKVMKKRASGTEAEESDV